MNSKELAKLLVEAKKLYDHDEFARGLKNITNSLKKDPKNAELIAWKALFLQKKKESDQATESINIAIRGDMKNPRIWKINGMIKKEQGDYIKAFQCYLQSHKMDESDNDVTLELCSLHLYFRNFSQFLELSRSFMNSNQQSSSVIRYIVALCINNRVESALKYLDVYESKLTVTKNDEEILFRSEIGKFHAHLLLKISKYSQCSDYLIAQKLISDEVFVNESLAQCYLKLGKLEDFFNTMNKLLERYPDNGDYFTMIQSAIPMEDYIEKLYEIKDMHKSKYAHVRILELIDISNAKFEPLLKEHMYPLLQKGSPGIYPSIEAFSQDKLDYSLKIAREATIPLSSVPIVHLLAGQIYGSRGQYDLAIKEIETGIKHTPTVVELYVAQTQMYSKSGKLSKALEASTALFDLDPADRNSNNIHVRQLYRNGFMKTARLTAEPFSIDQKKKSKLFKNEFNKIHFRAARCSLFSGDIDTALLFYKDVLTHFEEYKKGLYSFLSWGVRRPMSFVELIDWSESLLSHHHLGKAITNYFRISISKRKLSECLSLCDTFARTKNQEALTYLCVAYALNDQAIPALKCYKKLIGSNRFIATPLMMKLNESLSNANQLIRDVFNEEFKPFSEQPSTLHELLAYSRGMIYIGDEETAKAKILEVICKPDLSFKLACDIYVAASVEIHDSSFSQVVLNEIHKIYPHYEIKISNYEADDPRTQ